ncbi:hypothetical protein SAMN05443633_107104 [Chryseobacterium arachidis]|uniref:YD repeat-containing protein n=1 Tax=Chryseobacterium arachidis TaxID=1416778 RepID=A0A1M5EZ16_9FLAO|nr:hypothetical protein [Chryseobacterium arachidis]SHF84252.1 hypothetical protein SAMN05443633_107104 [Chryseobacterium arachidis]
MKIKTFSFLLIASSLALFSCNNNADEDTPETGGTQEKKLESYKFIYMQYPQAVLATGSNNVTIEYDLNNRPIKRVGGLLATSPQTGFNFIFSPNVYNEITYGNNTASIISKLNSTDGTIIAENKKSFDFENGKIIKKTILSNNETIQYVYEQNKISRLISTKNNHLASQSNIYYNQNGNVDSIVTRSAIWNNITSSYQINFSAKGRIVEVFKNYDNKANPTKNLMIFDEIFLRSLSQNNYSSYESKSYDNSGQVYEFNTRSWTLNYTNNEINFGN